jgi:hypothetical protein
MADRAGTLERIAIELANMIAQTSGRMRDPVLADTLAELGVGVNPIPANVSSAAESVATAGDDIRPALDKLIAAIGSEDVGGIVAASAELLTDCGKVIGGFAQVESALQSSGIAVPNDFGQRVFDLFIADYASIVPAVGATLTLLGIIERIPHVGVLGGNPNQHWDEVHVHWHRIFELLSNPGSYLKSVYKWGDPSFDGQTLFAAIYEFLALQGLPALLTPASGSSPLQLQAFAFDLTVDNSASPPGIAVAVMLPIAGGINVPIPLPLPDWSMNLRFDGQIDLGATGTIRPPLQFSFAPPTGQLQASAQVGISAKPAQPLVLFGQAGKSRLEVGGVSMNIGLAFNWNVTTNRADAEPLVGGKLSGGKLVIDTSEADGFIGKLLSGVHVESDFDFGVSWSGKTGVKFDGSAALEIAVPVNLSLGPVTIPTVYLAVGFKDDGTIPIDLSVALTGQLGPVSAAIDKIGVEANLSFPAGGGNAGPAQFGIAFKPPTGLGINIDAGPITGGGFIEFDKDAGRYAGVLALSLYSIQVKAIGLLDTKLPNGESGYSFLIIISIEFTPIQLGFGFTLNGVGGLCGINRDLISEALQAGLRQHSLDHILFPKDPVKNAPAIISDLRTIFPPAEGRYVFGPMLKLGWGGGLNLVTAELGIILSVPSPVIIAILGQLDVNLPAPQAAIVELHLDVLGIIDFGKKLFSLDASLHDSRVVVFTIYGDMAMRLTWGDHPSFALSVGGLNPHFQPPPGFPTLKRLTIALSASDYFKLSIQTYFAITSNSFQIGALAELTINITVVSVHGWLGFDALFIFSPFSFIVDFTAGLEIKVFGFTLLAVSVQGELSGPKPWHAKGTAHISILFFDIGVSFDTTWGDKGTPQLPQADPWDQLLKAINNVQNWSGALPPTLPQVVTLEPPKLQGQTAAATVLLEPSGTLSFREKVLPLNFQMTKFGETTPFPQSIFKLSSVALGTVQQQTQQTVTILQDKFAPGQFENLSDDQKLSRPSFEDRDAGFAISANQLTIGQQFSRDLQYNDFYVDSPGTLRAGNVYPFPPDVFLQLTKLNAAAQSSIRVSGLNKYAPSPTAPKRVTLGKEQYVVANVDDLAQRPEITQPVTKGEAYAAMNAHVANNPTDKGRLQVVPLYELAA